MSDWRMRSNDRVDQIGWLTELAADLAAYGGPGTGRELVDFWYSQKPPLPEWFDNHDLEHLVEVVSDSVGS